MFYLIVICDEGFGLVGVLHESSYIIEFIQWVEEKG